MSFIDYFRAAFDLAKKAQSVELQHELLAMRENYNELHEQNMQLQSRVKELEEAQALAANLTFRAPAYYQRMASGEDGPFCQRCWDVDKRLVRIRIFQSGAGPRAICAQCSLQAASHR